MTAPWNPPKKNEDFEFDICLEDYANPGAFIENPTFAAGDVKVSQNNGALTNITTLPTVAPAGSKIVRVQLSAAEMNTDKVTVLFDDQTVPQEWCDAAITILTTT